MPSSRLAVAACLAMLCLLLAACSCTRPPKTVAVPPSSELPATQSFDDYWYNHGAEISRYDLQQSRYGAIHPGDAVLIFVTEDFDPEAQVKWERPEPEANGAVPVLKLNVTKSFITGIYPYSMVESVFAPRDLAAYPEPLKVTTSSQEWCGHTFTQFNRRDDAWRVRQFSYFQGEGDLDATLPGAVAESGIWTRLRLAPETLPVGELSMIPSAMYLRLSHREIKAYKVEATLADDGRRGMNGEPLRRYTVRYPELNRTLTIRFHRDFPHVIEGWEETYPAAVGKPELLTTTAKRTHSRMLPYWSQHNPEHRELRRELGLPER